MGKLSEIASDMESVGYAPPTGITVAQLRDLVAMQANDGALWSQPGTIGEAYAQQALRCLTAAIEGEMSFEQAKQYIADMAA
jgi:hypothetical protein